MDARTMRQARAGAVTRLGARRRPPVTRKQLNRDGTVSEYTDYDQQSEFLPPENLAEWADDQLIVYGQYRGSFSEITCDLLVNAQAKDPGRAVKAILDRARRLDERNQFCLHQELHQLRMAAPMALPEVRDYMRKVCSAADGLELCDRLPEPPEPGDVLDMLAGRY